MSRSFVRRGGIVMAAAVSLLSLTLAACVVVPVDPRTGQPYPYPAAQRSADAGPRTMVVMPPVAPAPPQQSVLTARLYPLNVQANKGGLLSAVVVDLHTGRGSFTLAYQGETLQGEATRVDANYSGFGRIHAEVLGTSPRMAGGQRGIANAFGARGVNAQCEYVITGPALGTGVCLFSDGASYQLHFGG
jgi:hypothetical protein